MNKPTAPKRLAKPNMKIPIIGRGGEHMGHQGKPVNIPENFHKPKVTKMTKFPGPQKPSSKLSRKMDYGK